MKINRACVIGASVSLLILAIIIKENRYIENGSSASATISLSLQEEVRATPQTTVLIVRTVSQSEVETVLADVKRITSYQESIRWPLDQKARDPKALLAESLSQCNALHNSATGRIDVYQNGSTTFPNHILCDANRTSLQENNYLAVKADFFLFAKSQEVVDQINKGLQNAHHNNINQIETVDVSESPVKIWNWLTRLTDGRLIGYNYVWMVDGDISLISLNWHAFWQQVKLIKPRISQPAVIGRGRGRYTSSHDVLRHTADPRLIAAEVAIVELMAPLWDVTTWLGYREVITNQPEQLLKNLKWGGEDCFDLTWCHYAKSNLLGEQVRPGLAVGYHPNNPTYRFSDNSTNGSFSDKSCVVFYQTPVVHVNKHALSKKLAFKRGGQFVCKFLRDHYHIHWFTKSVYELFQTSA